MEAAFKGSSKLELVILMGLPGAGKSSFYRQAFQTTHSHVSKDLMGKKKHKNVVQTRLVRELLFKGESVVVDNMNLTRQNRSELMALAREANAHCVLYYFPLTVPESFQRNAGENRKEVPPVAIYSAAKNIELPEVNEGFDEIYFVMMESPKFFDVIPVYKKMPALLAGTEVL